MISVNDEIFGLKLNFDIKILPYTGDTSWIEKALSDAKECLMANNPPEMGSDCDYCRYTKEIQKFK